MIFLRHFEENLEALGFDLAPLAWDLSQIPYANESERREVLNDIIRRGGAGGDNPAG